MTVKIRQIFAIGLCLASMFTALPSISADNSSNPTWYKIGAPTFGNPNQTLTDLTDAAGTAARTVQPITITGAANTPPSRVSDSVGTTNEAISAINILTCPAGQVPSGGTCAAISSFIPAPTTCAFGKYLSGNVCVDIPPTPLNCGSGTYLSGGVCVPIPTFTPSCGTAIPSTQTIPCQSGQTGQVNQSRTVTCNASTGYLWLAGAWSTTSNTCATLISSLCPANQPTPTQTLGCAAGYTGAIVQTRVNTCNTQTNFLWQSGSWTTVSDTCQSLCSLRPQPSSTQSVACPSGQTGSVQQSRSIACDASTGYSWSAGNWYTTSSACSYTCPSWTQPASTVSVQCPSGYSGTRTLGRSVTCNTSNGLWNTGAWGVSADTCIAPLPPPPAGCSNPSAAVGYSAGYNMCFVYCTANGWVTSYWMGYPSIPGFQPTDPMCIISGGDGGNGTL